MRKFVAVLTALMIFFFSVAGEDGHAVASSCAESSVLAHHSSVPSPDTSSSVEASQEDASKHAASSSHDCHFGHCCFTLLSLMAIASPVTAPSGRYPIWDQFIPSGLLAETIRPPSSLS